MIGYIKLHRQLLDSPSFKNVHEQMAFAWLLLRAQWKDVDVRYKGIRLSLKRGQLALSYRDFAREWGWSEAKCRRYVTRLQSDAVVTAASDAGVCVITILNYNKFQENNLNGDAPNDAPMGVEVTQQRRTSDAQNKEDNKTKEVKKKKYNNRFEEFYNLYPRKTGKRAAAAKHETITKEVSHDKLIKSVTAYAESVKSKEKKYIPHPASWLNQGRWDDELEEPEFDPIEYLNRKRKEEDEPTTE